MDGVKDQEVVIDHGAEMEGMIDQEVVKDQGAVIGKEEDHLIETTRKEDQDHRIVLGYHHCQTLPERHTQNQ